MTRICAQEFNTQFPPTPTQFLIDGSQASLEGFVFSGAVYCFEKASFQNYKGLQNCIGDSEESEDKSNIPS